MSSTNSFLVLDMLGHILETCKTQERTPPKIYFSPLFLKNSSTFLGRVTSAAQTIRPLFATRPVLNNTKPPENARNVDHTSGSQWSTFIQKSASRYPGHVRSTVKRQHSPSAMGGRGKEQETLLCYQCC